MEKNDNLEKFNEAFEKLHPIAKVKGKSIAVFLAQSIATNADDNTLAKITQDIERFVEKWSTEWFNDNWDQMINMKSDLD